MTLRSLEAVMRERRMEERRTIQVRGVLLVELDGGSTQTVASRSFSPFDLENLKEGDRMKTTITCEKLWGSAKGESNRPAG